MVTKLGVEVATELHQSVDIDLISYLPVYMFHPRYFNSILLTSCF